ncbi:phage portal protein, partial [Chryseobacterium sp.]|uniref:anti-CBASS protein Acb1 family protein n=1 Tax=Chryseobacterium sp. TaxID=1871047 RepID=UPI00321B4900
HYQASLSTLDKLQAQSLEQLSFIASTPNVVLFGQSPSGLNATGDAELSVWDEEVLDRQQILFRDNLKIVCDIIQLSEWGEIDPSIEFEFPSPREPSPLEQAQLRKLDAETDHIRQEDGQISAEEVRDKISADPHSGYTNLPTMPKELKDAQYDDDEATTGTGEDDNSSSDSAKRGK